MITIVDYNAGNISSVQRALTHLGVDSRISGDPAIVKKAERILFPGVGNAASAMRHLNESGLGDALRSANQKGRPILGICLGSQIILTHSEEGDTPCLNLLAGRVRRLPGGHGLKVPHMGWNQLAVQRGHPILKGLSPQDTVYFVHSYYTQPDDSAHIVATTDHGIDFPVVLGKDNLAAVQFHPEKSGQIGLRMLKNFAEWEGGPC